VESPYALASRLRASDFESDVLARGRGKNVAEAIPATADDRGTYRLFAMAVSATISPENEAQVTVTVQLRYYFYTSGAAFMKVTCDERLGGCENLASLVDQAQKNIEWISGGTHLEASVVLPPGDKCAEGSDENSARPGFSCLYPDGTLLVLSLLDQQEARQWLTTRLK
jgi:hypothetical protein